MGASDEISKIHSYLRDTPGWYLQREIADEFNLTYPVTSRHLHKLHEHGDINWVAFGVFDDRYWFVPVPMGIGSYGNLITQIRELSKEGEISFEELGKRTGHGPRTLERMIDKMQRTARVGSYKNLDLNIEFQNMKLMSLK